MITDHRTDTVFFSDLLSRKCPELYKSITTALNERKIHHGLLPNTNDIWCRDYMPIQTADKRFVFYKYSPDYLDTPYYRRTITNVNAIPHFIGLRKEAGYDLDLILDGGNVVKCLDKVIMTEKVFFENKNKSRNEIHRMLEEAFQCAIIFLPWDRQEIMGHSDGIVHYIGNNRVMMTNYADFDAEMAKRFHRILENYFEVIQLRYNVKRKHARSWAYVNFLQVGKLVLVPQLGIPEDEQALQQIADAMPRCEVVGIPALEAVRNGGALNCISWNVSTSQWGNGFVCDKYDILGHPVKHINEKEDDAEYQNEMGYRYITGTCVAKDSSKAKVWFEKSAAQGFALAQYNLGLMYLNGDKVQKDISMAIEWFCKAAEQGNAQAQYLLGVCLEEKHASDKEIVAAYKKAADMGSDEAQCELGFWYCNGERGLEKDIAESNRWFLMAANNGNDEAQFQIGVKYDYGIGVRKSHKEALKWFMRAASKENIRALYTTGRCYYYGDGVRVDENMAFYYLRRSAERGYMPAMYMVGDFYCTGYYRSNAVDKDDEQAVKWYKKAVDKEYTPAQYKLGLCYYYGYGLSVDNNTALEYFRKAAEKEHADAIYMIGDFYYKGIVVKKDENTAIEYYKRAAELGNDNAKMKMKEILDEKERQRKLFDDVPF